MDQKKRLRGRPKSFTDKGKETRIQSLDRALDVLACVASGNGMTLTEIADELGHSPATVYRILTTFAAHGSLETDAASQEWFVGPTSFRIGSAFLRRTGLVERARPIMRALMDETGETANLGIEKSGQVLFLSQVETSENIRAFFPPGAQSPMYASGIGKALLAYAGENRIETYLKTENLEAFTDNTICNLADLRDELARIRTQGYAFDDEEKSKGMRCVAAPVLNNYGEVVAGISVSGPTVRLTRDRIETICGLVMKQAELLSRGLGYTR